MKNVEKIPWKDRDEDEEILCITFSNIHIYHTYIQNVYDK